MLPWIAVMSHPHPCTRPVVPLPFSPSPTHPGVSSLRGTLPWIAPEVIKAPKSVTELVDVYSFGIVLWELWLLREPFEGLNYHALLHLISTTPGGVRPALPGGWGGWRMGCACGLEG